MDLKEAAKALYTFLVAETKKSRYKSKGGFPVNLIAEFYKENLQAGELIRRRTLKKVCQDFPHLFTWENNTGKGSPLVCVKSRGTLTDGQGKSRVEAAALKFYNDCLKFNPHLRRACEDRNFLDQEIAKWKETERQCGKNHYSCSPSRIIRTLKQKKIIERVYESSIIVWKHNDSDPDTKPQSHRDRLKEAKLRVIYNRSNLEMNRNGIEIDEINFKTDKIPMIEYVRVGTTLTQIIGVHNRDYPGTAIIEIKSGLAEKKGLGIQGQKKVKLGQGCSHEIMITFVTRTIGIFRCIIIFDVSDEKKKSKPFSVVRYIQVKVGDPEDEDILRPSAPYQKKRIDRNSTFFDPVPIELPRKRMMKPLFRTLGTYGIPGLWRRLLGKGEAEDQLKALYFNGNDTNEEINPDLGQYLKSSNYSDVFHRLLWAEEAQMEVDIKNFDMIQVVLPRHGHSRYKLHCPGLAESRPSVLKGDIILLRVNGRSYEGYVDRVEEENAILQLPHSFQSFYIGGMKVDVRFKFKRQPLRVSHQGISFSQSFPWLDQILFPEKIQDAFIMPPLNSVLKVRGCDRLATYNSDLNREQKEAVFNINCSVARPIPYLIYGPPGTGKSITVVEAILQTVLAKGSDKGSRILVCAPSNSATDILVHRLAAYLSPREMIRIVAYSREKGSIPSDLMKFTNYDETENAFISPNVELIRQKRVVAVTVTKGGFLPNLGLENHFSHVFMDEAGHSIEPEAISCFLGPSSKSENPPVFVLAGDPKQLGPIIRSDLAKAFGLEQSLLERLSKRSIYKRNTICEGGDNKYDERVMTKLVRNYRSHDSILKLPNSLFYENDLIPCADLFQSHSLVDWEHLPTKGFPLIFHGVQGEDKREANSPSWFNGEEARVVKEYVDLLVKDTQVNRCSAEDIGVVTPYHKQAQKLKRLLRSVGYDNCKVGSVDEFQGSERRVIIISTVRSSVQYLDFDNRHQLGFLANPKRFNVAVTRAQALLIVVGNPFILERDSHWNALLQYCINNGGYTGCDYNPQSQEADDGVENALEGVAAMNLDGDDEGSESDEDFVMIGHVTAQEGPAWRYEE